MFVILQLITQEPLHIHPIPCNSTMSIKTVIEDFLQSKPKKSTSSGSASDKEVAGDKGRDLLEGMRLFFDKVNY